MLATRRPDGHSAPHSAGASRKACAARTCAHLLVIVLSIAAGATAKELGRSARARQLARAYVHLACDELLELLQLRRTSRSRREHIPSLSDGLVQPYSACVFTRYVQSCSAHNTCALAGIEGTGLATAAGKCWFVERLAGRSSMDIATVKQVGR